MNNNINLLGHKDQVAVPRASQRLKLLRVIAVLMLFGVSAASVILYILIAFSALPQVQLKERQAKTTLAQSYPEMTKIALIQDRINGISLILSQRNQYQKVIESLQNKMPAGLKIYQISISKKNATLTVTSNSLDTLETFLSNLIDSVKAKQGYAQVTLNSLISDDQSGKFSLTVSLILL
jgi:Tfp pilus assembly protein PilN